MLPLLVAVSVQVALPPSVDEARGFRLLTGPDATSLWRGYKQPAFPSKGWTARDGVLAHAAGGGGGDIITAEQFGDFELAFRFRTAPGANSGVIYRVAEKHEATWQTGPEFQVIDDAGAGLKPDDPHSTGAMYDLYPPGPGKSLRPAGEWNDGRIHVRNGVVQHWVNGVKVVDARLFDAPGLLTKDWQARIVGSKFAVYEGFGRLPRGHIALQDHGDEVAFRDVRVRDLDAPTPGEVRLFNGRDLTGWVAFVPEAVQAGITPESVWTAGDGVLRCAGTPQGYLRTERAFTNYVLRVQWRWPGEPGNSGVLVRQVGPDRVWPRSVEAQLHSGNAGDFWNIGEFVMTTDPARTNGRNTKKTHAAERPAGEWNEYEIIVNKGDVVLLVNGEEVNRATDVEEVAGHICLQSEGAPIEFRGIRLTPLE